MIFAPRRMQMVARKRFDCVSANREVKINEEFQDYAWVKPEDLVHYDLNVATRKTLRLKGLL